MSILSCFCIFVRYRAKTFLIEVLDESCRPFLRKSEFEFLYNYTSCIMVKRLYFLAAPPRHGLQMRICHQEDVG